ncbi:hypothetical protein KCU85_g4816, partial [Aureobasidium melanogenum]
MGATLSSPQLGDGLITAPGPGPPGPFATAFYVAATDTNSLGFTASVLWGTAMEARYTDTASVEKTVFRSEVQNDPSQTNLFSVSVLCTVANTQLGTGPVIFSLGNPGDGPATYATYVGRTTATAGPAPVTTTAIVPGLTTYLATVTSTVYETTETVAITTTLTGQYSTELCVLHQDQQLVISHPWFESHQNILFLADNFLFEGLINNELPLENALLLQGDFIYWGYSICQVERLQTIKKLCEHIKVHILEGHLENHKLQDLVQIDFIKQDNIDSPLQHRRYRKVAFQSSFYRKLSLSRHSEYQAGIPKLYLSLACIPIVECLFMF